MLNLLYKLYYFKIIYTSESVLLAIKPWFIDKSHAVSWLASELPKPRPVNQFLI